MRVILHSKAVAELRDAFLWYENKAGNLGHDLLDEVDEGIGKIRETPDTWPLYVKEFGVRRIFVRGICARRVDVARRFANKDSARGFGLRVTRYRFLVHRFPFGILYRIAGDEIQIVAIMHLRRKPGYWTKRLSG